MRKQQIFCNTVSNPLDTVLILKTNTVFINFRVFWELIFAILKFSYNRKKGGEKCWYFHWWMIRVVRLFILIWCIFCCCRRKRQPSLKGQAFVIGPGPRQSGGRGVVSTCIGEARKYGIHSAMSSKEALTFVLADFYLWNYENREVGEQVRDFRYTDLIDLWVLMTYLDVMENKIQSKSAVKIAAWFSMRFGKSCISQLSGHLL